MKRRTEYIIAGLICVAFVLPPWLKSRKHRSEAERLQSEADRAAAEAAAHAQAAADAAARAGMP